MTPTQFAAVASLMLAFTPAMAAERADPVVVINGANAPVPVTVTNLGGVAPAAPKSTFTDVFGSTPATVLPAPGTGHRFVVKHLGMFMSSNNSGVPLTDANCLLSLHQGSTSFTIAIYALQQANVVGAMGLSQGDYLVLGPTDSLEMVCLTTPANSSGRVVVGGDVLTGP